MTSGKTIGCRHCVVCGTPTDMPGTHCILTKAKSPVVLNDTVGKLIRIDPYRGKASPSFGDTYIQAQRIKPKPDETLTWSGMNDDAAFLLERAMEFGRVV